VIEWVDAQQPMPPMCVSRQTAKAVLHKVNHQSQHAFNVCAVAMRDEESSSGSREKVRF
jgi:hypothetical protein